VTNYPHFKAIVYALVREKFADVPPLPEGDLAVIAASEGALPLEAFIDEIEQGREAPG